MSDDGKSVFAKYITEPEKEQPDSEKIRMSLSAQTLLNWLRHVWPEPIISAREVYTFGPYFIRDRKSVIDAAKNLVEHGWLTTYQNAPS